MPKLLCSLAALVISLNIMAQSKRGNVGIFGFHLYSDSQPVALNFNESPPLITPVPSSGYVIFNSDEACATMCDIDGQVMFYTNGINVFNKQNKLMPNGDQLMGFSGSTSTTQIAIVPIPKDPFRYYIFTPQYQGRDLTYSLIDMRLDNGNGDVVFKNRIIYSQTSEKISIVKHNSGEALWMITHGYGTNEFNTFLIDENGLNITPVISAVGSVHAVDRGDPPGTNAVGYLKVSPNGQMLAVAVSGKMNLLELFSFNSSNGVVSDPMNLTPAVDAPYGLEFSPDNSKLYVSSIKTGYLYQLNLLAGSLTQIISSSLKLNTSPGRGAGALQLGPDEKIYFVGKILTNALDVIESPNASGALCNYLANKITLNGEFVRLGLPLFIYQTVEPEITYSSYCAGSATRFHLININSFRSITWNFGDDLSPDNFSVEISPSHQYKNAGDYRVKISVTLHDGSIFNYSQWINILPNPTVELGTDIVKCEGRPVELAPMLQGSPSVTWNDDSHSRTLNVILPGKYWLRIADQSCISSDTIRITDMEAPDFVLKDTTLCYDQSLKILLDPTFNYQWNDGVIGNERLINSYGTFKATSQNMCGAKEQTMNVSFLPRLELTLQADTLLCVGQQIDLDVTTASASYRWQDGNTSPTYAISETGLYSVDVYNKCETLKKSIEVRYVNDNSWFIPNVITPNGDHLNDSFVLDKTLRDPSITIFNKWGETVFFSAHYKNDWQGFNLSSGVYYYLIRDFCADAELKGYVHVLR